MRPPIRDEVVTAFVFSISQHATVIVEATWL
jgi:hypothetical protein